MSAYRTVSWFTKPLLLISQRKFPLHIIRIISQRSLHFSHSAWHEMWACALRSAIVCRANATLSKTWCVWPLMYFKHSVFMSNIWKNNYKLLQQWEISGWVWSYYLVINIEPLRMMVHLLCLQSHSTHEAERLREIKQTRHWKIAGLRTHLAHSLTLDTFYWIISWTLVRLECRSNMTEFCIYLIQLK